MSPDDRAGARHVAVVSHGFARRAFGASDPIGRALGVGRERTDPTRNWEIVGVVSDVHDRDARTAPEPTVYVSYEQVAEPARIVSLVLRGRFTSSDWRASLRQQLSREAPGVLLQEVKPLSRYAEEGIVRDRMLGVLCGYFGLIALLLTGIGLYGLMAQTVVRRTPEIGVRMAFGAGRGQVRWLVLRESLPLMAAGLAAGLLATLAVSRIAAHLLFRVQPTDPAMLAAALGGMAATSIGAVLIPAWRASRIEPLAALRQE